MRSGRPTGRSATVKVGAPSASSSTGPGPWAKLSWVTMTTQTKASNNREALRILPAPADKMHDLQPVPLCQASIRPLGAGNNVAVMLNRHSVPFKTEFRNQILQVGARRQLLKFTRLPIQDEIHRGR